MSKGLENVQNMSIMCPNFGHFMDMFVSDFFYKERCPKVVFLVQKQLVIHSNF